MPVELLKSTTEHEKTPNSNIETLRPNEWYILDPNSPSLEEKGPFSRLASFELGAGETAEGEALHSDDPRVAILDIWKDSNGDLLASPRSLTTSEEINEKAWRLADLPNGLPLGRARNDLWERIAGTPLPGEVSAKHFGIVLDEDGQVRFADGGSTNGTRMETAIASEPGVSEALSAKKRAFEPMTGSLIEPVENEPAFSEDALSAEPSSTAVEPTSIHERLGTEPVVESAFPEPEKKLAESAEIDTTLRAMKSGLDQWLPALESGATLTYSSDLNEVFTGLTRQMTWLEEMNQKELDPILKAKLNELVVDAQRIRIQAHQVADGVDRKSYSGVEAHTARHQVAAQLRRYGENIDEIFRILAQQSESTH